MGGARRAFEFAISIGLTSGWPSGLRSRAGGGGAGGGWAGRGGGWGSGARWGFLPGGPRVGAGGRGGGARAGGLKADCAEKASREARLFEHLGQSPPARAPAPGPPTRGRRAA